MNENDMQLSARGQQLHRRIALVSEFLGTSFLLHYIQGGSDIVADVSYDLFSSSTARTTRLWHGLELL